MGVREEHRINPRDLMLEGLVSEVWASIDQDDPSIIEGKAR